MTEQMSADEYRAMVDGEPSKPAKYRNQKVQVDNITFDSKAEGARYWDLCRLRDAGEITDLELQPVYPLTAHGVLIGRYIADFRYRDDQDRLIVEDVKSEATRTRLYRWKQKMVLAQYGIVITEVQ